MNSPDFAIAGLVIALILVSLVIFIVWIWMLVDCLTKESSEGNDKLIWGLVIFFGGIIGALIYLIVRRPERKRLLGR